MAKKSTRTISEEGEVRITTPPPEDILHYLQNHKNISVLTTTCLSN